MSAIAIDLTKTGATQADSRVAQAERRRSRLVPGGGRSAMNAVVGALLPLIVTLALGFLPAGVTTSLRRRHRC